MSPFTAFRVVRIVCSFALACILSPHALAAESDAQRQLREDRERFQREIERQRNEAEAQAERARQAAEQQRTADELARLRAQQDRQSSELRSLSETTRARASVPAALPSPRIAAAPTPFDSTPASPAPAAPTITPDFAVTVLPDGNCVLHIKGRAPEVKSPSEAQAALRQLLASPQTPVGPAP